MVVMVVVVVEMVLSKVICGRREEVESSVKHQLMEMVVSLFFHVILVQSSQTFVNLTCAGL